MATLRDMVEEMMGYANTKADIAHLKAANQAAPKYLYEQATDHMNRATEIAVELDEKLENH